MPEEILSNQLVVEEGNVFRILQLTDFHSDVSESDNERTRSDVRAMVAQHQPHFLAVTGDIWCGDGQPDAAPMWMARDLDFIASLQTPWAFTWGNHDFATDYAQASTRIARTPYYVAPNRTSRGESRIEVSRARASISWDLFFVNTMKQWRMPKDLDWLRAVSKSLEKSRGRVLPAMVFFHIPLRRYQIAIDEGRVKGIALEEVLSWGDESDTGADIIASLRNIRACFCGHSHRNDCHFEENGVTFAYGRSTGYGGYGDDVRKGAKLITVPLDDDVVDFETVFGDGTMWRP